MQPQQAAQEFSKFFLTKIHCIQSTIQAAAEPSTADAPLSDVSTLSVSATVPRRPQSCMPICYQALRPWSHAYTFLIKLSLNEKESKEVFARQRWPPCLSTHLWHDFLMGRVVAEHLSGSSQEQPPGWIPPECISKGAQYRNVQPWQGCTMISCAPLMTRRLCCLPYWTSLLPLILCTMTFSSNNSRTWVSLELLLPGLSPT